MHFPVVVYDLAVEVDGDASVPGVGCRCEGVLLHYAEFSPEFLVGADGPEGAYFGAVKRAHDGRIYRHRETIDAVFWVEDQICVGVRSPGLPNQRAAVLSCFREVIWGVDLEQL